MDEQKLLRDQRYRFLKASDEAWREQRVDVWYWWCERKSVVDSQPRREVRVER